MEHQRPVYHSIKNLESTMDKTRDSLTGLYNEVAALQGLIEACNRKLVTYGETPVPSVASLTFQDNVVRPTQIRKPENCGGIMGHRGLNGGIIGGAPRWQAPLGAPRPTSGGKSADKIRRDRHPNMLEGRNAVVADLEALHATEQQVQQRIHETLVLLKSLEAVNAELNGSLHDLHDVHGPAQANNLAAQNAVHRAKVLGEGAVLYWDTNKALHADCQRLGLRAFHNCAEAPVVGHSPNESFSDFGCTISAFPDSDVQRLINSMNNDTEPF